MFDTKSENYQLGHKDPATAKRAMDAKMKKLEIGALEKSRDNK